MIFRVIDKNREDFMNMLLIADPDEKIIKSYINKGDLIIMEDKDKIIGICHFKPLDIINVEITNIAIDETLHNKGYGSTILKYTINFIKNKGYKSIFIGTGNSSISNIAFYQKNGFDLFDLWINYFLYKYDDKIYENGIQCKHMLRFKLELM
ncbi:MAG: GNAT family N-acetyltransferase [Defluviitaleaceae bacterium]|nr:GNAT family N-acetyltransferase [Defluviitaleaceae bacterium]